MRVLMFAASLRDGSFNRRLIEAAAQVARRAGADVDLAELAEFDMPLYDGDVNAEYGLPSGALALQQRLEAVGALVIAAPEYNYSISGVLKNAIDWVSRARPMPWRGKSVYLMSASPSPMGGIRGLWQTRIPLEGCGALVFPDMFALPYADRGFAEDGRLRDPDLRDRLECELRGFLLLAESVLPALVHRPATAAERERRAQIAAALEQESELQPQG